MTLQDNNKQLLSMSDRIVVMHRGKITVAFASSEATQERILAVAMDEKENHAQVACIYQR